MSDADRLAQAYLAAEANLADVAARRRVAAPPCKRCVHSKNWSDCAHPLVTTLSFSAETGDVTPIYSRRYKERNEQGLCRPEGVLFERRTLQAAVARFLNEYSVGFMILGSGIAIVLIEVLFFKWLSKH